jgi:hypothetical protein
MRILSLLILLVLFSVTVFAQQVDIPKGVVYKYCDSSTYEKALKIVTKELTGEPSYELNGPIVFIGPVIWTRYQKIKSLKKIEGGNVTFMVDDKQLAGKMTQSVADSKIVLDELRKEIKGKEFKLRKATYKELQYYWSVISFDIEEPLIIVETAEHRYILNILPKDFKLLWLDEVPSFLK